MKNFIVKREHYGEGDTEDITHKVESLSPIRWELKYKEGFETEQIKMKIQVKDDSFSYIADNDKVKWEISFSDVEGNTVKIKGLSKGAEFYRETNIFEYTITQFEYIDFSEIVSDDPVYFHDSEITGQENLPNGIYFIQVTEIEPIFGNIWDGHHGYLGAKYKVSFEIRGITETGETVEGSGVLTDGYEGRVKTIEIEKGSLTFQGSTSRRNVFKEGSLYMFAIYQGNVKAIKNGGLLSLEGWASLFGEVENNLPSVSFENQGSITLLNNGNRGFDMIAVPVGRDIVYLETFADFDDYGYTREWGVRSSNTDLIPDLEVSDTNMIRFMRLFKAVDDEGNTLGVVAVQHSGQNKGSGSYLYHGVITRLWVLDINNRTWVSVDIADTYQLDAYTFQLVGSKNDGTTPFVWAICANSAKDGTSTNPRIRKLHFVKITFGSSPSVSVHPRSLEIDCDVNGVKMLVNTAYFDLIHKEYGIVGIEKVNGQGVWPMLSTWEVTDTSDTGLVIKHRGDKPLYDTDGDILMSTFTKDNVAGAPESGDFEFGVPAVSLKLPGTGEIVGCLPTHYAGVSDEIDSFIFVIGVGEGRLWKRFSTDYRMSVGAGWDFAVFNRVHPTTHEVETGLFYAGIPVEKIALWKDNGIVFFVTFFTSADEGFANYDFWLKTWVITYLLFSENKYACIKQAKFHTLYPEQSIFDGLCDLCRGVACLPIPGFSDTGNIALWRVDGEVSFTGTPPFGRQSETDYDGITNFAVIKEKSTFIQKPPCPSPSFSLGGKTILPDRFFISSRWLENMGGEDRLNWEYVSFWELLMKDFVALREVTLKEFFLYPLQRLRSAGGCMEVIIYTEYNHRAGTCKVKALSKITLKGEA